jgi:membrane protein implicated in regulation of membrane protease activity
MTENKTDLRAGVSAGASVTKKIKRGSESWTFFYTVFGIFLAIALALTAILPIDWLWKSILFIISTLTLSYLCLISVKFQNKMIGWKNHRENQFKEI